LETVVVVNTAIPLITRRMQGVLHFLMAGLEVLVLNIIILCMLGLAVVEDIMEQVVVVVVVIQVVMRGRIMVIPVAVAVRSV